MPTSPGTSQHDAPVTGPRRVFNGQFTQQSLWFVGAVFWLTSIAAVAICFVMERPWFGWTVAAFAAVVVFGVAGRVDHSAFRRTWPVIAGLVGVSVVSVVLPDSWTVAPWWWLTGAMALSAIPVVVWARVADTSTWVTLVSFAGLMVLGFAVSALLALAGRTGPSGSFTITRVSVDALAIVALLSVAWTLGRLARALAVASAVPGTHADRVIAERQLRWSLREIASSAGLLGVFVPWGIAVVLWCVAYPFVPLTPQDTLPIGVTAVAWLMLATIPVVSVGTGIVSASPPGRRASGVQPLAEPDPLLDGLASGLGTVVLELDRHGVIVRTGPGLGEVWPGVDLVGTSWLTWVSERDRPHHAEFVLGAYTGGVSANGQCHLVGGVVSTAAFSLRPLGPSRSVVMLRSMDAHIGALESLRLDAEHDALSGLRDASSFHRDLPQRITSPPPFGTWAILHCEVRVLGHLGRLVGADTEDHLWNEVVDRIVRCVDHGALIGRTGMSVVSIVLPVADAEAALRRAQTLVAAARSAEKNDDGNYPQVGVRVGFAVQKPGQTHRQLVLAAQSAADHVRTLGWGAVTSAGDASHSAALSALSGSAVPSGARASGGRMPAMLRSQSTPETLCTPILDAMSGQPLGVSVEVGWRLHGSTTSRWTTSGLGISEPEQLDLDRRTLRASVNHMAAWRSGRMSQLSMVFPTRMANVTWPGFVEAAQEALAASAVSPGALTIVLPAEDLATADAATVAHLRELTDCGIRLGVSAGSLADPILEALRCHTFDGVILDDRAFGTSSFRARSMSLLNSVVNMSRDLGATVTMTSVGTNTQARLMQKIGVHRISGPVCSDPVPARMVADLIQRLNDQTCPWQQDAFKQRTSINLVESRDEAPEPT